MRDDFEPPPPPPCVKVVECRDEGGLKRGLNEIVMAADTLNGTL